MQFSGVKLRGTSNGHNVTVQGLLAAANLALCLAANSCGSQDAEPAQVLLRRAEAAAKASNKRVLLVIGATWCAACRDLNSYLAQPTLARILNKEHVLVHLDSLEGKGKENLVNAGTTELYCRLAPIPTGIPYCAVLDAHGKKRGDGIAKLMGVPHNFSCPSTDEERMLFFNLIVNTSPGLSTADRSRLKKAIFAPIAVTNSSHS